MGYLASFLHVWEIADQVDHNWRSTVVTDLAQPLILDVLETAALCNVKDEEDAIATLIEVSGDWAERFLACRIPNLKLDVGLFAHNHAEISKLNSDSDPVLLFECLARESFQNASLADACIAQDHDLEEDIKVVHDAREVRIILDGHSRRQVVDLGWEGRVQSIHFIQLN